LIDEQIAYIIKEVLHALIYLQVSHIQGCVHQKEKRILLFSGLALKDKGVKEMNISAPVQITLCSV
jgi:hypothetical protein